MSKDKIRVAAVGDLHCTKESGGQLRELFRQAADSADVLVLCGDLTDHGLAEEAHVLAKELGGVRTPVLAVLGNHDFHNGAQEQVELILRDAGVQVLSMFAVALELMRDWRSTPGTPEMMPFFDTYVLWFCRTMLVL